MIYMIMIMAMTIADTWNYGSDYENKNNWPSS